MSPTKKSFVADFYKILELLKRKETFAFNRFSDGELIILQDKELILGNNLIKIGSNTIPGPYKKEDYKHFDPTKHSFYKDRLMDAFLHTQNNYFKGISCRCCASEEDYLYQMKYLKEDSLKHLTWANLLVNANYPRFIAEMLPIFNDYPVVFICNEKADLKHLPWLNKSFRVGYNALINDYNKIEEIREWIEANNIEDHLFIFSASSFSKVAIHQLFSLFPQNTYIDIGTTLNAFIDMSIERQYLGDYWKNNLGPADTYKVCIW